MAVIWATPLGASPHWGQDSRDLDRGPSRCFLLLFAEDLQQMADLRRRNLGSRRFQATKTAEKANDWISSNDSAATCRHRTHGTDPDTTRITIYQYMNNLMAIGALRSSM